MSYTILNSSIIPNILGLGNLQTVQNQTQSGNNTILNTTINPQESFPIGVITQFLGQIPPVSWLVCNGSTFDQLMYPDLFIFLGNSNVLPDLRGQVLKGANNQLNLGDFQLDQNKEHSHTTLAQNLTTQANSVQSQSIAITGSTNSQTVPIYTTGNQNSGPDEGKLYRGESDGGTFQYGAHSHTFNANATIPLQSHQHLITVPAQTTSVSGQDEVRVKSFGINYIIKASVQVEGTSPGVSVISSNKINDNTNTGVVQANIDNISMNQPLTMNNNKIIDVLDPTNSQDVSTKNYTDTAINQSYLMQQSEYEAQDAILQSNINQVQTNLSNAILSGCLDSIVQLDDNTRTLTIQNGDLIATNIDNFDLTGINVIGLNVNSDTLLSTNTVSKMFIDSTAPKASVFCQQINTLDFRAGVDKMLYDMQAIPQADEVVNKAYVDNEIDTHTHNQIVQVNNPNTYVLASGNTVETKLNNVSVQEATLSSFKNTLPFTTVQNLNFNAIWSQLATNSLITRDIAIKMHLLSSYTSPVGDALISSSYFNIIDANQTVMRHVDTWVSTPIAPLIQFGTPMIWSDTQQHFIPQFTGLYRISYQMSYIVDPQTQVTLDVNLAIPVQNNNYPYSQMISGLYDLTNQTFVQSNANRTDMSSQLKADRTTIFDHVNSFVTYLNTTSRYRMLSPVFQFGGGALNQQGRLTYSSLQFEFMQK